MVATLFAEQALLPDGWARNVAIARRADARSQGRAGAAADGRQRVNGPVLPGMVNLHSMPSSAAMAGLTEVALNPDDSSGPGAS
jgi:formimidoylglutamate deiminase